MSNSNNVQNGFTLLEIIMVLVLLGILSATILPRFFDVASYRQQAFFDDTLAAVRYAQKLAVASGCRVQVSVSANSYVLNMPASRNQCLSGVPVFTQPVRDPGTGATTYSHAESGVTLTSAPASFVFDALGRASANAVLTVAGAKTINVVRDTGFVFEP